MKCLTIHVQSCFRTSVRRFTSGWSHSRCCNDVGSHHSCHSLGCRHGQNTARNWVPFLAFGVPSEAHAHLNPKTFVVDRQHARRQAPPFQQQIRVTSTGSSTQPDGHRNCCSITDRWAQQSGNLKQIWTKCQPTGPRALGPYACIWQLPSAMCPNFVRMFSFAGGWQLGHDTVPAARLSRLRGSGGAALASYALASSAMLPRRLQQQGSGLLSGFGATTATPETTAMNPAPSPGAGGSGSSSGGASAAASAAAASAPQAAQMASSGDCSGAAGAAAAAANSAQSAMIAAPGKTPLRFECPTHSMCGL